MTGTDLSGVDHKIKRAKTQLANLKCEVAKVMRPDAYRFRFQYDAQVAKHVYTVHDVPPIPPDWSLLFGEILHNLRSALDHLAWQLVLLDGKQPGDNTNFPVRESPFDKKGNLHRARLVPKVDDPRILDALEACQPYRGPDGQECAIYTHSLLWTLHRLNIIDKHRLLLVIACVLDVNQIWWGHDGEGSPPPGVELSLDPVEEGTPVAWFDFHGAEPPQEFDPHVSLSVVLNEWEVERVALRPVTNVLDILVSEVESPIMNMAFRPLFPS